jgi:hypothetical protein
VIYSEYSMIQYDIAKTIFTDDIYCNPSGSYTSLKFFGRNLKNKKLYIKWLMDFFAIVSVPRKKLNPVLHFLTIQ